MKKLNCAAALFASCALALFAPKAQAWGAKEHILLTRIAAERILADPSAPAELKAWLAKAAPGVRPLDEEKRYFLTAHVGIVPRGVDGVAYWSVMPDLLTILDREKRVEPFGVSEGPLHFIDLEYFMKDEKDRVYADDLSHRPALADIPRDMMDPRFAKAGMLPFRVAECVEKMAAAIKAGRLVEEPGKLPHDENATRWAGMLAHYAADNTQPQHATMDYRAESAFKGTGQRPPTGVHGDVEYRLLDDDTNDYPELRKELCESFFAQLESMKDPIKTDDPWQATVEVAIESYGALPLIGKAAKAGYLKADGKVGMLDADAFFHVRGSVNGAEMTMLEMKARQMAWAVLRIERLWRLAWDDSVKSSRRHCIGTSGGKGVVANPGQAQKLGMRRWGGALLAVAACALLGLAAAPEHVAAAPAANPRAIDFSRDIQPILSDNCYRCHGPDSAKRKAGLRFDTQAGALAKLKDGFAIVPGDVSRSEMVSRIESADADEMMPPPASTLKLTSDQKRLLRDWVASGAKWGRHWAFIPPVRPALPSISKANWVRNPIDAFILSRLEREGLAPSPEADKATLIRRITLDLTGLPPAPEEVDAFLADASPTAYEKVVDRLLASPHYGERMAWDWLDAARYADTNGYQGDSTRTMWPWRDWVVRAMNANMPFDQFTIDQLAGDLLPSPTVDQRIATGFCRNHPINGEGGRIPEENRVDYVMDQSESIGTVWLGLTVGCCRCHDHKYDPIAQKEYYQLFAFFNNTPVDGSGGSGQTPPVIDFITSDQGKKLESLKLAVKEQAASVDAVEQKLFPHPATQPLTQSERLKGLALSGNVVAALKNPPGKRSIDGLGEAAKFFRKTDPAYADALEKLRQAMVSRDQFNASIPRVMVMQEMPKPREAFILEKGAYDKRGEKVVAGTPACLPPLPAGRKVDRLALARWLVSAENPLTARVAVNRIWQQFFGVGLVKTSEDFGSQGEKPVNPELLDWLAVQFRESGWNVKAMHKLIVTSAAYRQSSKTTPELLERDPENRLLARGARYRLPSFMLRDQALTASGLFVDTLGGPGVKPYQPSGIWEEATFGQIRYAQDHGDALYRRSLYTFWRRIVGPPEFFDSGARQTCVVRASRTNTPLQALTLLNDTTFVEAARALAQRALGQPGPAEARIDFAWRRVLARHPSARELEILRASLKRLQDQYAADEPAAIKLLATGESKRDQKLDPSEHAAWTALCLEILNTDEAVTRQ